MDHFDAPAQTSSKISLWLAPAWFALATLLILGPTLFRTDRILAGQGTDVSMYFLQARIFGFGELTNGNLPLWNPYLYGGTPFLAGFQSALLYPPNWLHLVMPVAPAMNWIIALHVFAAGFFTYLWLRQSGIGRIGAIVGGTMFVFSGNYFYRLYAGHLPHMDVMAWIPLIFLSIGKLAETGKWRWCLLGALAVAMQILAGHPQYCFYTGIACGLLMLLQLRASQHRFVLVGGLVVMYFGGAMLSAMQLVTGVEALQENVRGGGTAYKFAATIGFAPEQLLTALAPRFFGNMPVDSGRADQYWGYVYLWEESAYVGVIGLLLAIIGAVRRRDRLQRIALTMIVICFLLALGRHTPLHRLLYDYLPLYGSFRGTSKFILFVILWLTYLAGTGVDSLLDDARISKKAMLSIAVVGIILVMVGIGIKLSGNSGESGQWARFVRSIWQSSTEGGDQFLLTEAHLKQADFIARSASVASTSVLIAAGLILSTAAVLWAAQAKPRIAIALPLLAVIELLVFGWVERPSMDPALTAHLPPQWKPAIDRLEPHQRILLADPFWMSHPMSERIESAWGYDPQLLKRYAETMFTSQGYEPSAAMQYISWRQPHDQIFGMTRIRFILLNDQKVKIVENPHPMPMVQLINHFAVANDSKQLLAALSDRDFNPRTAVLLENDPGIKPVASASTGTATLASWSTDALEIKADAPNDCILLITNNYSTGWTAKHIGPGVQNSYTILPANHTLQAIPLRAGKHHLHLEYRPTGFVVGTWLSIVSWLGFFALLAYAFLPRFSRYPQPVTKPA